MHHLIIIVVIIILTFILTLGYANRDREEYNNCIDNVYKLWAQHAVYTRLDIIAKMQSQSAQYRSALLNVESRIGDLFGIDNNKFTSLMKDFHSAVDDYIGSYKCKGNVINGIIDTAKLYEAAERIGKFLDIKVRSDAGPTIMQKYADAVIASIKIYNTENFDDVSTTNALIQSEMELACIMCKMF
jgi:hypothetical protein